MAPRKILLIAVAGLPAALTIPAVSRAIDAAPPAMALALASSQAIPPASASGRPQLFASKVRVQTADARAGDGPIG